MADRAPRDVGRPDAVEVKARRGLVSLRIVAVPAEDVEAGASRQLEGRDAASRYRHEQKLHSVCRSAQLVLEDRAAAARALHPRAHDGNAAHGELGAYLEGDLIEAGRATPNGDLKGMRAGSALA